MPDHDLDSNKTDLEKEPEHAIEIEKETENGLEEETGLGQRLRGILFNFQENHPWLLFATISLVIFVIIVSLLLPVISSLFNQSAPPDKPTNTANTSSSTPENSVPLLATTAFQESLNFSDKADYLRLIKGTIYDLDFSLANDHLLEQELLSLKNADLILSYDVVTSLQQTDSSRTTDFERYLQKVKTAYETVASNNTSLNEKLQNLQTTLDETQNAVKISKTQLNQALLNGSDQEVSVLLSQYLQNQEQAGNLSKRIELISEVTRASKPTLQKLRARLAGLQANREALLAGIQVIDIDQSGLNLIRQGQAADYLN